MELPHPEEDPLAQPTRARIFAFLADKRAPADTGELAGHLGLHPNGVRRHLERLLEAGLVRKDRIRTGRGRPRDSWAIAPGARPGGERPRAYAELATWLARAAGTGPGRLREVERVGREIGGELAPPAGDDPVARFSETLAALGFEPTLDRGEAGFACCLGNCPYRDAARQRADVVCTLHRGITAGLLAELDPKATLTKFAPHDPELGGCSIEVSGGAGAG